MENKTSLPTLARILYFTGSGSTALVSTMAARLLKAKGMDSQIIHIKKNTPIPPLRPDFLEVWIFPVYAFSAPSAVLKFCRSMEKAANPAIVLACHGGGPYGAAERFAAVLAKKGRRIIGVTSPMCPAQFTQAGDVPAPEKVAPRFRHLQHDLEAWLPAIIDKEAASALGQSLSPEKAAIANRDDPFKAGLAKRVVFGIISPAFRSMGRHVLGLMYAPDHRCTSCGVCVAQCPTGTIRMDKHKVKPLPHWGLGCSACNRCINICPEQAIQCTWLRLFSLLGINIGAFTAWLALGLTSGPLVLGLGAAIYLALSVLQITIQPRLIAVLERNPLTRSFALAGWTKKVPRYLAPKTL